MKEYYTVFNTRLNYKIFSQLFFENILNSKNFLIENQNKYKLILF